MDYEEAQLEVDTKRFAAQLKEWVQNKDSMTRSIHVMEMPLVMELIGIKPHPIYIDPSKLSKIYREHPTINRTLLKQLPRALADPVMIADSMTKSGRIVAALDLTDIHGVGIVVPFELYVTKNDRQLAHVIASVYPKEKKGMHEPNYDWYYQHFEKGIVRYVNKEKAAQILTAAGVQFSLAVRRHSFINPSIKTEEDLVKLKMERMEMMEVENLLDFAKDLAESIRKNKATGEPWHPTDDWQIVDKLYDYAKTANLVNEKAIGKALAAVSQTPALENNEEMATSIVTNRLHNRIQHIEETAIQTKTQAKTR